MKAVRERSRPKLQHFLIFFLLVLLTAGLTACGRDEDEPVIVVEESTAEAVEQEAEAIAGVEETPTVEEAEAEEVTVEEVEVTPEAEATPTEEVAAEAGTTPAAEVTPTEEETVEADTTPAAEATPTEGIAAEADTTPEAEGTPAEEETPQADTTPEAEEAPTEEVTAEAEGTPTEGIAAEADTTPEAEGTPAEEETPQAEATPTTDMTPQPEGTPTAQAGLPPTADEERMAIREVSVRATNLIGRDVQGMVAEEIGQVEDLLIGIHSNRVRYVLIDAGNMMATGNHFVPVPFQMLQMPAVTGTVAMTQPLVFAGPVTLLSTAPVLTPTDEIDLSQPDWDQDLRDYWQEPLLSSPMGTVTETVQTVLTPVATGTVTLEEGTPQAAETVTPQATAEETAEAGTATTPQAAEAETPEAMAEETPEAGTATTPQATETVTPQATTEETPEAGMATTPQATEETPEAGTATTTPQPTEAITPTHQALLPAEPVMRASDLIGRNIGSGINETEGQIVDLLIGQTQGRVNYAVIALDGDQEELVIVPFASLELAGTALTDPNEPVTFDVEPQMLQEAPRFQADQWPDTTEEGWDEAIFMYWEEILIAPTSPEGTATPGAMEETPEVDQTPEAMDETATPEAAEEMETPEAMDETEATPEAEQTPAATATP